MKLKKFFLVKKLTMYKGKIFFQIFFKKLAFFGLDTYGGGTRTGTGTVTSQKSEPEP
jgi:hypothetical protein